MFHFIQKVLLVSLFSLTLQAQSGLSQKHLLSLSPEVSAQEVSADTSIAIKFDLSILSSSLKKNTIVLKNDGKKVKGVTTLSNNNTLLFTPNNELTSGEYRVKVKKIKLQDSSYENLKGFKKFAYKFCSYFYDDVKNCPLCKYLCSVQTKKIKYSFNVDDNQPKVIRLTLNKSNIQLNEDNTTTISVDAEYDNNETLDVTDEVEWIMSNSNVVSINKNIITPTNEGTTILQAKFKSQTTAEISVTVYKEINGYKLPPEPDPTINNSTLLGVDVNNNGVRDDVERYVVQRYSKDPEFPKTKTALAMQYVWAEQQIIDNPVIESRKFMNDSSDCEAYWLRKQVKGMATLDGLLYFEKHEVFNDTDINDKIYNTRERIERSFEFNQACSGNIFNGREAKIDYCHTNLDELGE